MKIVFTGGSSLSGLWMARALAQAGNEVHATLRTDLSSYQGIRAQRVRDLAAVAELHPGVTHGHALTELIADVHPGALVIHAHPMEGFRDSTYPVFEAVREMTDHLRDQVRAFVEGGGSDLFYSGTVFEPAPWNAGISHPAVSAYGLSKNIVYETLRMHAAEFGRRPYKFVIPNPYGPLEEGRFGNYLAQSWGSGRTPVVRTPNYIRDNIPVQELSTRFRDWVQSGDERAEALRPSGYIESQVAFARRVAHEVGRRLSREFDVEASPDPVETEPLVVINDGSRSARFSSDESVNWDDYAAYVAQQMDVTGST